MSYTQRTKLSLTGLLLLSLLGACLAAGCSHNAASTSPQEIKAAMGGHYSPEATAQGRAYQANDTQKQGTMIQTHRSGTGTATPSMNP